MCLIIDKWTLNTVGLFDPRSDLRDLSVDIIDFTEKIHKKNNQLLNFGFTSIESYFYNLRIRMNRFIEEFTTYDLNERIGNREQSRMEIWITLQDFLVYYLESIEESMVMDKEKEAELLNKMNMY